MDGWVKIHRELLDKPIWACSTTEQKVVLVTLLLMVNYEDREWEWQGERFMCKAGQMVTSLEKIAERAGTGISIRNVRTAIARFENCGFLTNRATKQGRIITICNWSSYQCDFSDGDNCTTNELTNELTKQLTNELTNKKSLEQSENKQLAREISERVTNELTNKVTNALTNELTTNKNIYNSNSLYISNIKERDKEKGDALNSARPPAQKIEEKTTSVNTEPNKAEKEKKVAQKKEKERANFKKPTTEEVQAYITEKGYGIDAEQFTDYYEANGWIVGRTKMKDWKATVRNWARREQKYTRIPTRTEPININDRWND